MPINCARMRAIQALVDVAVSDQHRWEWVEDKEDLDAAGLDGSLLWLMEKPGNKGKVKRRKLNFAVT
jgi:hypothetical protein